ncbi:MAG TPA: response regulator [Novimethylophilus sp.]|jgi:two-component system nitrate/nitrite response regulator NarL|uniref:response regulator n=1 Tax=Novimethylophilus sp. TaxID=2137426 RepID=UPI002F41645F
MNPAIKVLIIDDHALFRRGVSQIISATPDFEVVGETASGWEGLEKLKALRPDLVLLDLDMKDMNGWTTLAHIKEYESSTCCIVLTASDAADDLLKALRTGADGYLLKGGVSEDFCAKLKKAMSGVTVLQESLMEKLVSAALHLKPSRNEKEVSLTGRETEILRCLTLGFHNKTIAHALGISLSTVKVHTKNLLIKLKLSNRLEAAAWAYKK